MEPITFATPTIPELLAAATDTDDTATLADAKLYLAPYITIAEANISRFEQHAESVVPLLVRARTVDTHLLASLGCPGQLLEWFVQARNRVADMRAALDRAKKCLADIATLTGAACQRNAVDRAHNRPSPSVERIRDGLLAVNAGDDRVVHDIKALQELLARIERWMHGRLAARRPDEAPALADTPPRAGEAARAEIDFPVFDRRKRKE